MKRPRDEGYVLLEVMIATTLLLIGIMAVTESFHSALRAEQESRDSYRAALLLEDKILEIEKSRHLPTFEQEDPELGPVIYTDEVVALDGRDWMERTITLQWKNGFGGHSLELATTLSNR